MATNGLPMNSVKGGVTTQMFPEKARPSSTGDAAFAETHWSVILRAKGPTTREAEDALEILCRTYWYPLYGYARRQGEPPANAQDLTQDFFAHLLEKNALQNVDPTKGKFRSFALASFKNFLANKRTYATALKRGGGRSFISLDQEDAEARFAAEPYHELSPDKAFDQTWALAVLSKVFSQLQKEYVAAGKSAVFEILQAHLSGDKTGESYANIATRLTTTEAAVKMAVMRLRRRYGQLLRVHIGQTVAAPEQVEEELRDLFSALAG